MTIHPRRFVSVVLIFFLIMSFNLLGSRVALAQEKNLDSLKQKIEELKQKVTKTQGESKTLSSALAYLTKKELQTQQQMKDTESEISRLEQDVDKLSKSILKLEFSLEILSKQLVASVQKSYRLARVEPYIILLDADTFSDLVRKYKYVEAYRADTQQLMFKSERQKQEYETQRSQLETTKAQVKNLQSQLQKTKDTLAQQQKDKAKLLEISKNNEQSYQQELQRALIEYDAIQQAISSTGNDMKVGEVKRGEKIASIIPGPSTCSTGGHVHFEVVKQKQTVNPAEFLKQVDIQWSDDSFSFTGNWDWPLNNPAKVMQGYGMTSFARSGFYGGRPHTGIDMKSKSANDWAVLAVENGTLFRGSVKCGKGNLQYVRVDHANNISSYYLHVNY
ncbi:MAG: hypothetical protein ABI758_05680 [Candidatus Woesebacteria bacterium]